MSTRVYRTLLWLYPKSFRLAYGEDMVAVFEEMRRDRSPAALWWRVTGDAFKSVIVQRLEKLMSTNSTTGSLALAAAAAAVVLVGSAVGSVAGFFGAVVIAFALASAALITWTNAQPYQEPSDQLDRYWLHCLGGGVALIALVNIGTGLDLTAPWLLLFGGIIFGVLLISIGIVLGAWHGLRRMRAA